MNRGVLTGIRGDPIVIEIVYVVASATGMVAIPDVGVATVSQLVMTGNVTLTFPAAAAGKSLTIVLVQDATGSRTITWPASITKWAGGTAPTISTGANKVDVFTFTCVDGVNWLGFTAGLDMR